MDDANLDRIKSAAKELTELRHTGRFVGRLPEGTRPQTFDDALKIQERTMRILGEVGGWKCSVPQGDRKVICAPIFAATISTSNTYAVMPATPNAQGTARIEPEVAFKLGRDLPPRAEPYTEAEIRAAIGEPHLVLEILASRYTDSKAVEFVEQLADCISNQGLVIGPKITHDIDVHVSEIPLTFERTDTTPPTEIRTHPGRHPDGHPLLPFYWLANHLSSRGIGLKAGQIVTTGSYAGMVDVPLDAPIRVVFGDLGEMNVTFSAKA
jgi:2-keto-4-pentenoate hydratase